MEVNRQFYVPSVSVPAKEPKTPNGGGGGGTKRVGTKRRKENSLSLSEKGTPVIPSVTSSCTGLRFLFAFEYTYGNIKVISFFK
jgi:hypothetical protein